MKRISLHEIEVRYKIQQYHELYDKVLDLIETEQIKPVKASGKNGKRPALYKEYWSVEHTIDYTAYEEEISYQFTPIISTGYYLNHMKQYEEDREWVLLLNQYLKTERAALQIIKSVNERSFEIWHREKFLKDEQGKKILKRCGISLEQLNVYETTEPLVYYAHTKKTPQNLLIVENKDTFYSMRKHLLSGKDRILGQEMGTLIYGAGKGILRSFRDFSLCVEPYMREQDNAIYYFGDLDYEGIIIYESLAQMFGEQCEIRPFTVGYIEMISKAYKIGVEQLPCMKDGQNHNIHGEFWNHFSTQEVERVQAILKAGRYVPQEILAIDDFQKGL